MSARPEFRTSLWPLAAALAQDEADCALANQIADRLADAPPRTDADVRAFFKYALNASRYEDAGIVFDRLPARLRRAHGTLYYANILQRQGRFAEAKQHVELIQAAILSTPSRFKAYSCYSLIKRVGELGFLERTAEIWSSVPQPRHPERVIVIAPRNLHQLTRYPLVVLLEMKRQGWAVVPLFEGLLPKEETGDLGLDLLNGCLTLNRRVHPAVKDRFAPVGSSNGTAEPGASRSTGSICRMRYGRIPPSTGGGTASTTSVPRFGATLAAWRSRPGWWPWRSITCAGTPPSMTCASG